ncbi:MAG: hypothetical protein HFG39_12145 [Lachnospiraceae bacterium]|nr:hypothetical protein [Lachnospiraceae bacterium]
MENIPLKFRVSYSDDVLAIAICYSEVELDIEKIDKEKNLLIKKKFFLMIEKQYLEKNDNMYYVFMKYGQKKRLM